MDEQSQIFISDGAGEEGVGGVKMMKNEIGYIWRGGRGAMGRQWGREK